MIAIPQPMARAKRGTSSVLLNMDRSRLLVTLAFGLAAGLYVALLAPGIDIATPITGARYLLAGLNPYQYTYSPDPRYAWLYYPLPALILVAPVAWLPDRASAGILCGVGYGLLVYAVWPRRHLWPILCCAPVADCLRYGNPFPLVCMAVWFLPALAPLALAKPNVALPVLLSRPRWQWLPVGVSAALIAASIPLGWLDHLGSHDSLVLLTTLPGAVGALCLVRFRDPRARLVLLSVVVPLRQYDTGMLLLAGRTVLDTAVLCFVSWALPDMLVPVATLLVLATTAMPQTRRHSSAARMPTARY